MAILNAIVKSIRISKDIFLLLSIECSAENMWLYLP